MPTSAEKFSTGYKGIKSKSPPVKPKPVKVSVPYAPSPTGKAAERKARGPVAVPYAPTPTGKAAERAAAQKTRRIKRVQAVKALRSSVPPRLKYDPSLSRRLAQTGVASPPRALEKLYPRSYEKQKHAYVASHEGLKEDPLAELAISTAATAGLGLGAKALGTTLEKGAVAALGSKAASTEATAGSTLAERALKAAATKLRNAPKAAVEAPVRKVRRIKAAPGSAVRTAKRTPELKTSAGRSAAAKATGRAARRHPVRSGYGAVAAFPGEGPAGISERARAAAEGTVNAVVHHPGETVKTTLRSLPAAITAPAALLEAAGESAIQGTPKPLAKTASEQAKGVAQIAANAFSGDPKKAEEAARKEGSLAFLTPLPAVTRLKAYERGRGVVRRGAGAIREKLAAKGEAANRSIRHAPVEQPVFAPLARHEARKRTALIKQRADNPQRVAAAHHEKKIRDAISKAPKGSHVALQTLAEYGIRDVKHAALVRERGPGDTQLIKALDYVDAHPHVFQDKAFKKALAALGEASRASPAALVGKGERARLLQQGDVLGHQRPEQMAPPEAARLTGERSREGAWSHLQSAEARLRELRRQGRTKLDQAKVLSGPDAARARTEGKAIFAQARKLQADNKAIYKALDPYTRPGHSIDASKRMPYDAKMLDSYKKAVEASREQAGMAKAIWTHHALASGDKGTGMGQPFPTSAGRVEHMREGNLAKADNLDRSLEGVLRGTVHLPRLRAAGKQFGRDFVEGFKTPFKIGGKQKIVGQGSKDWEAITAPRSKENPDGGQFDPKSWARFPLREWKNAVKDPFTEDTHLAAILAEAEAGRVKGSEPWVLMPREAIKEARAQISPQHNIITELLNRGSRVASRTILGTNPAWAISQVAAEGIPLLLAKPSLLNPVKLASLERDLRRYRKSNPEESLALQATAGASPLNAAVNRTPLDMQETYTPALWDKGAKALTRGKTARTTLSFAKLKALGVFDVKRQNEYRTLIAAAEADKRFRSWHSGLTDLFDSSAKLSRQFRGKSRAELWDWLTKDPKGKVELQKITDYVENIQGNWTSFTRYERALAPLAIFYPFLRYSLRWTLWTFPRTHPITATIAYTLGQANANQLEKLVGHPLGDPLAYAYPAYQNAKGETNVLPGGSRISPGQSNLTQALATGNPAQVLSSANPFVGAGITGLTGIEPFTGEKSSLPQGEAAVNALLAMPAPVRLAGVKLGGQSAASKAFAATDPQKAERSFLFPFLPQSGKDFKASEDLAKAFSEKYGEGHQPGPFDSPLFLKIMYGNNGGLASKAAQRKALAAVHASEAASAKVRAAEKPFYPPAKSMTAAQKRFLEEWENAWKTGPNGERKREVREVTQATGIGGSSGGGIGGHPIGGPIGGAIGGHPIGGIGGHPIGGR